MSIELVFPALIAVVFGTVAGSIRWTVRPALAMRLLSGIAAAAASTFFLVLAAFALGLLARSALVMSLIDWCPVVPLHHEVGYLEGSLALIAVIVIAVRVRGVWLQRRRATEGTEGRRFTVLDRAEPIAYAAPGRPGCVVVSRGMLDALEPRERQVVFAHERAHLQQKHHRYLLTVEVAVAALPVLRPLAEQMRLATERGADEAAVIAVGGDRTLVAHAVAHAAISTSSYRGPVGAIGGSSVPARVQALLGPPPDRIHAKIGLAAISIVATAAVAAGTVQFHHFAVLVDHLCSS